MGQHGGGMRVMYMVWIWLLVLTVAEVLLAYFKVPLNVMLVVLIAMSVGKAFLIMAWFMHLKFERASLVMTLIPAVVICILLLNIFFPDSVRLSEIGVWR
jgi:cytochrome c oxidase subunit 4